MHAEAGLGECWAARVHVYLDMARRRTSSEALHVCANKVGHSCACKRNGKAAQCGAMPCNERECQGSRRAMRDQLSSSRRRLSRLLHICCETRSCFLSSADCARDSFSPSWRTSATSRTLFSVALWRSTIWCQSASSSSSSPSSMRSMRELPLRGILCAPGLRRWPLLEVPCARPLARPAASRRISRRRASSCRPQLSARSGGRLPELQDAAADSSRDKLAKWSLAVSSSACSCSKSQRVP
mmetsp:Transcript_164454/g.399785  ORF Transcript_164454/g.399785 Transcript_164454/m.399785 type:complete len:241 (-) Transcript_164454:114-836(-)